MFRISFLSLFFAAAFWPFQNTSPDSGEIKKTQLEIPRDLSAIQTVRVLVLQNVLEVYVDTSHPYDVYDTEGRKLFSGSKIVKTALRPTEKGIFMGKQHFVSSGLRIDLGDKDIHVGEYAYGHAIEVLHNAQGRLDVVNELPVEEYLRGVLPKEVHAGWLEEILKAQAIASRTYALFRTIENSREPYALVSDVKSQVYGGRKAETEATDRAIEATRGQVLTYQGKIFPAYFHSTCGGHTTRADLVWKVEKHPCLMGVGCRFCQGSKHYRWKETFKAVEIQEQLKKMGLPSAAGLAGISAGDRDASGRLLHFIFKFRSSQYKMPAADFRMLMGSFRFKSTLIDLVEAVPGGYFFKGRGWGHGVGLCQYGAKQLAELGYDHKQILDYYYPQSVIRRLEI